MREATLIKCHFLLFMDESTPLTEICPICLDAIGTEGEHQMCATPCGHLCGDCCLQRWVEENKNCPICRKSVEFEQIRKIVWNGRIPLDSAEIDNLDELSSLLRMQNQKLTGQIQKLQRDINIIRFESNKASMYKKKGATVVEKRNVGRPSLVFDHDITSGYRCAITSKQILITQQNQSNQYGISTFDTTEFKEDKFIPLHDQQIRELKPSMLDTSIVATVSTDCKLIQTSIRTKQSISKVTLPTPLWSCEWVRPNCIACGGTNGQFYIIDGRGDRAVTLTLEKGPPITSILRIDDDYCYAVTPRKGLLYDIKASSFTKTEIPGFNIGNTIQGSNKFLMSISRKNSSATFAINKVNQSKSLSTIGIFHIDEFSSLARPSAVSIGSSVYIAVPNGKTFSLFSLNSREQRLGNDFWSKWRSRFYEKDPLQILDIAIGKPQDLLVASVTEKKLRVYAIPQ